MPQKNAHTLGSAERLKSRKLISKLFREGAAVNAYPLRFVWLETEYSEGRSPVQMAPSVPKRKFKRAVDRNRLKRQIREAYRMRKPEVYDTLSDDRNFVLMVLYIANEKLPYQRIAKAMAKGLRNWQRSLTTGPTSPASKDSIKEKE